MRKPSEAAIRASLKTLPAMPSGMLLNPIEAIEIRKAMIEHRARIIETEFYGLIEFVLNLANKDNYSSPNGGSLKVAVDGEPVGDLWDIAEKIISEIGLPLEEDNDT